MSLVARNIEKQGVYKVAECITYVMSLDSDLEDFKSVQRLGRTVRLLVSNIR